MAFRSANDDIGSSATPTISVPAGTVANDIIILSVSIDSAAAVFAGTFPAGFTIFDDVNVTADGQSMAVGWKRTTGTEAGTYALSSVGVTSDWCMEAVAFSGRDTVSAPTRTLATSNAANASPVTITATGVTATAGDDLCWVAAPDKTAVTAATFTQPSGYTSRSDRQNGFTNLTMSTKDNSAAGATGSVAGTLTGQAAGWAVWLIQIPQSTAPGPVSRVAVTTGAPAAVTAFAPTLPTHATGDRLILAVMGKDQLTTIPTINQSWVLLRSGTGGTGTNAADTGQTFYAIYGKDALSGAETAPTVTPGATAPNSWEWICASYRLGSNTQWRDAITTTAGWVQGTSDIATATPLAATAGVFTGQPTDNDAILAFGVIPTDLGTALGATTLTATGLSGGTKTTATTQYVENALGNDTAAVWADWVGFTGTASAGLAMSFTITGSTNHAGNLVGIALRSMPTPVLFPKLITTIAGMIRASTR